MEQLKKYKISQAEVAEISGVSQPTISRYFRGSQLKGKNKAAILAAIETIKKQRKSLYNE